jgi:VIT1/CCC1 family predicted Fe2+/Mn2+ transporter
MTKPIDSSAAGRWLESYREEVDSAALYRALAGSEPHAEVSAMYGRMARAEERHARFWARKLSDAGIAVPPEKPSWRARILCAAARRFGPGAVLPTVVAMERDTGHRYAGASDGSSTMAGDERHHARLLRALAGPDGADGGAVSRFEGRHRAVGGNALRAAVMGANDGLVSNLSLVMGVAGAQVSGRGILLTGIAGLLAGATSMAMGEWLSVQSSRELAERQLSIEAAELAEMPGEEAAELALIYRAKGLPEAQAKALADALMADPKTALDTLAREELGIDPDEMGGSPWEAAGTSFVLFAVGAIVPVAPYLFLDASSAWLPSIAVSALALVLIGGAITLFTGKGFLRSAGRQLLFGLGAAALTWGVGRLLGVTIS